MTGTVIGIFKENIEILFDEPFVGGTSLNGKTPSFRGGYCSFREIFNLSHWSKIVIEQDNIREFDKCWQGDFDIFGVFDILKRDFRYI